MQYRINPGDSRAPGGRVPAPPELAPVQDFVNAHFDEELQVRERPPQPMAAWFARHDLLPRNARWTPADREHVLQFRRAVRELLEANDHDGAPPPHAVAVLNRLARDAALRVEFDATGGADLRPTASGVERPLGALLAMIFRSMLDGTWQRLKICRADDCRWAYYDRSKNGSGAWCSMLDCGNRAKARAYRERRRS
jgi:predicted RNA-binding Zn ribbon-like protein